jgi:hypothetical protein
LRCEALPGAATIIARSHPLDAAVCNRVSSRAFWAPCRRPAGTVLAPASNAVPSCMNSAAVAIGWPSRSATKHVAQARLNFAKSRMYGMTSGCSLQPCAATEPYKPASLLSAWRTRSAGFAPILVVTSIG